MEDDPTQKGSRSRKDFNTFSKPQADEIALRVGPFDSYWSPPPHTGERMGASSTNRSSSSSIHVPNLSMRTPSRNQQQQASTGSAGTSLATPPQLFYSEGIPPMKEEDVGGFGWVGFVTLVEQTGGQYRHRSGTPATFGGFCDVWKCDSILSNGSKVVVAVKTLRAIKPPSELSESETRKQLLKRLEKELRIWMRLQHPNIAPLLGFNFDEEIAIISPWFSRGDVSDYLKVHPEADRTKLVRGVAAGLGYLHSSSPAIIHGNMKPDNVLIDQWDCPRIIDFGLCAIIEEDYGILYLGLSVRNTGTARWIAPELLWEEGTSRSRQSDMFSFGCVAFFIFTGDIPFKGIPDAQLVISRYKGASPIQDGALYPNLNTGRALMEILRACWKLDPQARPEIRDVVQRLKTPHPGSDAPAVSKEAIETSIQGFIADPLVALGRRKPAVDLCADTPVMSKRPIETSIQGSFADPPVPTVPCEPANLGSVAPAVKKQTVKIKRSSAGPPVPLVPLKLATTQQGQPATRKWSWATFGAFLRNLFNCS